MGTHDLGQTLRANLPRGSRQVTLFIPSRDKKGQQIDQEKWTREALRLLGRLFRGATAFPPGLGVWRDDAKAGKLLEEVTVIVTSYTNPADHTPENLDELAVFLHRFGAEAHQGEVGIVVDDQYFGISKYARARESQPKRRAR